MTRKIVDTDAPFGYEVAETSEAKDIAMDRIQGVIDHALWLGNVVDEDEVDMQGHDAISVADEIVEALIEAGWRPTVEFYQ